MGRRNLKRYSAVREGISIPGKTLYRSTEMELEAVGETREADAPKLFRVSMSSEYPVQRAFGREILSHAKGAIDTTFLSRGMPVLVRHQGDPVGIVKDWTLDEATKKLRGSIKFSRSARGQEVQQDVEDGVLHFTSVGYDAVKAKVTKNDPNPELREVTITRWVPKELTLAATPADPTVGIGRQADGEGPATEIEGGETREERQTMKCNTCNLVHEGACATSAAPTNITLTEATTQREAAAKEARESAAQIYALAQANGLPADKANDMIRRGLSREQAAFEILDARTTQGGAAQPAAEVLKSVPQKDMKRYSYARAIHMAAMVREGKGKLDGVEGEVHTELLRTSPTSFQSHGGVLIPHRLREALPQSERALDSKTASGAAETVFDTPGELIELLRNRSAAASLGARILSGLTAPVPFPKMTGAATARWVGENSGAVAASQLTTGIVTLQPKSLMATTSYSRQLLMLASIDVEAMVRDDLGTIHGLAIDLAAFHGQGAAGEPQGIYNLPDVQVKSSFGVPTYIGVTGMVTAIAKKNALRNTLGWVTTPELAGKMATTPVIAGAAAGFVWNGNILDGQIAGFRAMSTNQISATMSGSLPTGGAEHGLIFGNWNDLIIGLWGALEVVPDPYTLADQALIKVTTFQLADVLARHGESFAKATGAVLV